MSRREGSGGAGVITLGTRDGLAGRPDRALRPAPGVHGVRPGQAGGARQRQGGLPGPGRLRPARPGGQARRPVPRPQAAARVSAARQRPTRAPFIALIMLLLAGGLVCLLAVNTTLATASFRLTDLQRGNAQLAQRIQSLRQEVATDEAPGTIERRAYRLGMRVQNRLTFLDLRTGRIYRSPAGVAGVTPVPGYTP
jgi:cell division protein FtsB